MTAAPVQGSSPPKTHTNLILFRNRNFPFTSRDLLRFWSVLGVAKSPQGRPQDPPKITRNAKDTDGYVAFFVFRFYFCCFFLQLLVLRIPTLGWPKWSFFCVHYFNDFFQKNHKKNKNPLKTSIRSPLAAPGCPFTSRVP